MYHRLNDEDAGCLLAFLAVVAVLVFFAYLIDTGLSRPFEVTEEVAHRGFVDDKFFIITIDKGGGTHKLNMSHEQYKNVGDEVTLIGRVGISRIRYEVEIK